MSQKPARARLRLENLEIRANPAPITMEGATLKVAGYTYFLSNDTSPSTSSANGFGEVSATGPRMVDTINGALVSADLSDGFDGALSVGVVQSPFSNFTYSDTDGIVDLTGTTITSDPATLSRAGNTFSDLTISSQFFIHPTTGTIRAIYSFTNNTTNSITTDIGWFNNLGSDSSTVIRTTSDGNATFDNATDRWFISFQDAAVGLAIPDPRLLWVRQGPGMVRSPANILSEGTIVGASVGLYYDSFEISVDALQTQRLMMFVRPTDTLAAAEAFAPTFDSTTALRNSGLLAGLSNDELASVLNWDLQGAADATVIAVGADAGGGPQVQVGDAATQTMTGSFYAYDPAFRGGVRVAVGDVNNDGVNDVITGAGPGGGPHVKVIDGTRADELQADGQIASSAELFSFFAYDAAFTGGVFVGAGDVNGDGFDDIITGAGAGGGPHVRVFSGVDGSVLSDLFAYDAAFRGGVSVAGGDVTGDGNDEVITGAGPGGGPHVQAFEILVGATTRLRSFFAYDVGFTGGVFVGSGDINGDGIDDIITGAGAGGGPHVQAFDGSNVANVLSTFFAYDAAFAGGVRVGTLDVNGDGTDEIVTGAGPGGGPHFQIFSNGVSQFNTNVFDPGFLGGIYVS